MNSEPVSVRVLYLGGDVGDGEETAAALERAVDVATVETAATADEALARLGDEQVGCIVSEQRLSDGTGTGLLERVRERDPELPFVLYPAEGSEAVASEAVSLDATDYLSQTRDTEDHDRLADCVATVVDRYRERRATERSREQERARRRSLLEAQQEAIIDGILIVDEDGEIVSYNDRFLEVWGFDEAVVCHDNHDVALERAVEKVRHPETFRERVEYLYDHPDMRSRDEIQLADGRVLDRYTTPLTGEDGTYYGRLWTFRDITERKDRERKLQRQNERLEEFAGVVSHDLQSPLAVARGRLEMARDDCDSPFLDEAAEALERSAELVDELLSLARSGEAVSDTEPVALRAVAEDCWQLVETADATLAVETDRTVRGDPGRVRQLFENLLRNAVGHGGDDVTVTVGGTDGGFYVADDGPGIDPDERDRLFEPGYSSTQDGTGFGLNIVAEIVDAHGWSIEVTESAAGGARFEISGVDVVE